MNFTFVPSSRAHAVRATAVVVLMAGAVGFELATRARTFTEQDSINLANALTDFNPAKDQPHPPGYPLIVGAAHLFDWFFTPLGAYLALDLVATLAALASTYWLARAMFGRTAAIVAAALVWSTPLVLYYGSIVSVYPPEMALTPLIALLAFRVATSVDRMSSLLLLPVLAVAGGFRPTLVGLMFPTCALALVLGRPALRTVVSGVIMAAAIVCAWAAAIVIGSGGVHPYLQRSRQLYGDAAHGSILHGGTIGNAAYNVWFTATATVLVAFPAVILVAIFLPRLKLKRPTMIGVQWWILFTWFASYFLFYAVVLLGKPGYLLAYVPALDVAAAGVVARRLAARPVAILIAIAGMLLFVTGHVMPLPSVLASRHLREYLPTADSIRTEDRETRGLERFAPSCLPPSCTIVSLAGSPRFFYHDADSLRRRYAQTARVVVWKHVVDGSAPPPHGRALWIGAEIPAAVADEAKLLAAAGTWHFYASTPKQTALIVQSTLR